MNKRGRVVEINKNEKCSFCSKERKDVKFLFRGAFNSNKYICSTCCLKFKTAVEYKPK